MARRLDPLISAPSTSPRGRTAPVSPVRMCVGCRGRATASELLRVVVVGGVLVPDPDRRRPGRGAHVHPVPECLAVAERRRAFDRALRAGGPLDAGPLREQVTARAAARRQEPGPPGAAPTIRAGHGPAHERSRSTT